MKKPSYLELATSFFKINMVTFGGGYAIMPIIKKTYVDEKFYLTENDMLDIIALAQSIPGAMAINTSMLVGYKLRGVMGALVSLIGAFLPPLLVISVVFLRHKRSFRWSLFSTKKKQTPITPGFSFPSGLKKNETSNHHNRTHRYWQNRFEYSTCTAL